MVKAGVIQLYVCIQIQKTNIGKFRESTINYYIKLYIKLLLRLNILISKTVFEQSKSYYHFRRILMYHYSLTQAAKRQLTRLLSAISYRGLSVKLTALQHVSAGVTIRNQIRQHSLLLHEHFVSFIPVNYHDVVLVNRLEWNN